MQNLYNELVNGITETNDKGEMLTHPPSSLMLRAARTLKQLADINDTNMINITGMQQAIQRDHTVFSQLSDRINELNKEVEQLKTQQKSLYSQLLEKDENLRKNSGQQESQSDSPSLLGDNRTDNRGSDQRSEGGIQFEDSGLGSN
jgi:chaperonin cofactor prefoldin